MKAEDPVGRPDVIVMGASAGGVQALTRFVGDLPGTSPLPVLVVLHIPPTPSALPEILGRARRTDAARRSNASPVPLRSSALTESCVA